MPSNILEVIVFPSPANPVNRSLLVAGAKEIETSLDPVRDFVASAIVRARNKAVVDVFGAVGCH